LSDLGIGWRRATEYAFAQAVKLWRERGNEGWPDERHLKDWVPYYLAQQWLYEFPAKGSMWENV